MPSPPHTFGPTCALYQPRDPPLEAQEPPNAKAQFFYVSALPIDDPLSPLPPVASESKSARSKYPPQPFSIRDNAALEEAWIGYLKDEVTTKAQGEARRQSMSGPLPLLRLAESERSEARSAPAQTSESERSIGEEPRAQSSRSLEHAHHASTSSKQRNFHSLPWSSKADVFDHSHKDPHRKAIEEREVGLVSRNPRGFSRLAEIPEWSSKTQDQENRGLVAGMQLPFGDDTYFDSIGSTKERRDSQSTSAKSQALLHDESPQTEFFGLPIDSAELEHDSPVLLDNSMSGSKARSSVHEFVHKRKERMRSLSPRPRTQESTLESQGDLVLPPPSPADLKTSGRPFARVPSQRLRPSDIFSGTQEDLVQNDRVGIDSSSHNSSKRSSRLDFDQNLSNSRSRTRSLSRSYSNDRSGNPKGFVPVGVSRLHLVEIPDLLMKPIYWNPINDISNVLRSTWFYKNTMAPLEPDLANQLENGYEYMRPWTDAWQDELNSIAEIGADAELKIVHRLWPEAGNEDSSNRPSSSAEMKTSSVADLVTDETKPLPQPKYQINISAGPLVKSPKSTKLFKSHSVIYVNGTDAQILRPSLLPSPSRGRRPLSAIRKGRQIGVAVVRGFDRDAWDKIHPPKKMNVRTAQAKVGAYLSQSGDAATQGLRAKCPACRIEEEKPQVTDLILVVHGIGQKLSERVDSFHFTHAINDFRRQVNIELSSEVVQGKLRAEMGGIMVLPINWRLTLSLDDGEPEDRTQRGPASDYHLKDITPETLPAVRNLISDVMLDIPYYLSNHKQKMIAAVVKEANRVYRLWCRNNPGFHKSGRVHLIAHSLGSAMVMDVLSQQPTKLPKNINPKTRHVEENFFEFDTKSLFCCGSPAGFFLLLNRANLLPRKGRDKPGADGDGLGNDIGGESGTYGCLAVDNIYNVMHYNDPIAYHVNATVDHDYAASLKPAQIPNANPGFFASLGGSFNWSDANNNEVEIGAAGGTSAVRPGINKLPTTIEMDTHDFSREEIAEKRMFLLNDNGQIDYFLSSGGGPLEIQYLSMLSAHSSYWTLQDFIRFVVLEVGRRPGRAGTLPFLRAEKKRTFKAGKII